MAEAVADASEDPDCVPSSAKKGLYVTLSIYCFPFSSCSWLGDRKGIRPVKVLGVGLLLVMIWLELCTREIINLLQTTISRIYNGDGCSSCLTRHEDEKQYLNCVVEDCQKRLPNANNPRRTVNISLWVSRCLLKLTMMELVVVTGAISRAKLESNHHHQQTNTQFLQAGCPSCHPTNSVKALKGKISHSLDLFTPSSPGIFKLCHWPLIAPGYHGGGLPCLSSALWCQYPNCERIYSIIISEGVCLCILKYCGSFQF